MLLPYFFCKAAASVYPLQCCPVLEVQSLLCILHFSYPGVDWAQVTAGCDAEAKFLDAVDSNFMGQAGKSPKQMQP